jgi:hypothetical protein
MTQVDDPHVETAVAEADGGPGRSGGSSAQQDIHIDEAVTRVAGRLNCDVEAASRRLLRGLREDDLPSRWYGHGPHSPFPYYHSLQMSDWENITFKLFEVAKRQRTGLPRSGELTIGARAYDLRYVFIQLDRFEYWLSNAVTGEQSDPFGELPTELSDFGRGAGDSQAQCHRGNPDEDQFWFDFAGREDSLRTKKNKWRNTRTDDAVSLNIQEKKLSRIEDALASMQEDAGEVRSASPPDRPAIIARVRARWRDVDKRLEDDEIGTQRPRKQRASNGRDYRDTDRPLVDEMRQMMQRNPAISADKAAASVVDRAEGGGARASKIARLAKRCRHPEPQKD